jgi:hypothetical protein
MVVDVPGCRAEKDHRNSVSGAPTLNGRPGGVGRSAVFLSLENYRAKAIKAAVTAAPTTIKAAAPPTAAMGVMTNSRRHHGVMT